MGVEEFNEFMRDNVYTEVDETAYKWAPAWCHLLALISMQHSDGCCEQEICLLFKVVNRSLPIQCF